MGKRGGGGEGFEWNFHCGQFNDLFFIQHSFTLTRLATKQLHNALDDIYSYNRNIRHLTTIFSEYQFSFVFNGEDTFLLDSILSQFLK